MLLQKMLEAFIIIKIHYDITILGSNGELNVLRDYNLSFIFLISSQFVIRNSITLFCLNMVMDMLSLLIFPCDQVRVGPSTIARFSAVMLFTLLRLATPEKW